MLKLIFSFILPLLVAYKGNCDNNALYNEIKQLVRQEAGDLNFGIYIKNLDTGQIKFSLHANRLFVPASTTKLFTAYTALNYLGPEYKFQTSLTSEGKVSKEGVLNSDLYIKFVGDPSFTYEDFKSLFAGAKITKIKGNIIIDDSMIDRYGSSPGGFTWDDQRFCYAAPKSAIIIDKNCSKALMEPSNISKVAKLEIDRPYALGIMNTVETIAPRELECPYKSKYLGNNQYEVYGCMFNNIVKPVKLNFALPDTHSMVKAYTRKALEENNIKLTGSISIDAAKATVTNAICTHESQPLGKLLDDILQDSCNLSSGVLFKHMAAKYTGRQGSDEDGELMMKEFLTKEGLKKQSFRIKEGDGGSRYNLVSPQALVSLLTKIYNSQKIKELFITHLPKYGDKGTLKYRMIKENYSKYIYAKTGSLTNISSLAGFYLPPKGNKYAFAIMINNHDLSFENIKSLEDKILYLILAK